MNTLSFSAETHGPDDSGKSYLVPVAEVDRAPLADFKVFALDLKELLRSLSEDGEHFILTCWCGVPDCVRIASGFIVVHRDNKIQWRPSYPVNGKTLIFDAKDYAEAIRGLLQSLPDRFQCMSSLSPNLELVPSGCEGFLNRIPDSPPA